MGFRLYLQNSPVYKYVFLLWLLIIILFFYAVEGVAPLASFHKMLTGVNNWSGLKLVENDLKGWKTGKREFFRQLSKMYINKRPIKKTKNIALTFVFITLLIVNAIFYNLTYH